jgi:hypothetical protein
MSLEEEESQVGTLQVIVVAGALAKNSNSKLNIVNKKVSKFFFPSDVILDPTPLAHQMMLKMFLITSILTSSVVNLVHLEVLP